MENINRKNSSILAKKIGSPKRKRAAVGRGSCATSNGLGFSKTGMTNSGVGFDSFEAGDSSLKENSFFSARTDRPSDSFANNSNFSHRSCSAPDDSDYSGSSVERRKSDVDRIFSGSGSLKDGCMDRFPTVERGLGSSAPRLNRAPQLDETPSKARISNFSLGGGNLECGSSGAAFGGRLFVDDDDEEAAATGVQDRNEGEEGELSRMQLHPDSASVTKGSIGRGGKNVEYMNEIHSTFLNSVNIDKRDGHLQRIVISPQLHRERELRRQQLNRVADADSELEEYECCEYESGSAPAPGSVGLSGERARGGSSSSSSSLRFISHNKRSQLHALSAKTPSVSRMEILGGADGLQLLGRDADEEDRSAVEEGLKGGGGCEDSDPNGPHVVLSPRFVKVSLLNSAKKELRVPFSEVHIHRHRSTRSPQPSSSSSSSAVSRIAPATVSGADTRRPAALLMTGKEPAGLVIRGDDKSAANRRSNNSFGSLSTGKGKGRWKGAGFASGDMGAMADLGFTPVTEVGSPADINVDDDAEEDIVRTLGPAYASAAVPAAGGGAGAGAACRGGVRGLSEESDALGRTRILYSDETIRRAETGGFGGVRAQGAVAGGVRVGVVSAPQQKQKPEFAVKRALFDEGDDVAAPALSSSLASALAGDGGDLDADAGVGDVPATKGAERARGRGRSARGLRDDCDTMRVVDGRGGSVSPIDHADEDEECEEQGKEEGSRSENGEYEEKEELVLQQQSKLSDRDTSSVSLALTDAPADLSLSMHSAASPLLLMGRKSLTRLGRGESESQRPGVGPFEEELDKPLPVKPFAAGKSAFRSVNTRPVPLVSASAAVSAASPVAATSPTAGRTAAAGWDAGTADEGTSVGQQAGRGGMGRRGRGEIENAGSEFGTQAEADHAKRGSGTEPRSHVERKQALGRFHSFSHSSSKSGSRSRDSSDSSSRGFNTAPRAVGLAGGGERGIDNEHTLLHTRSFDLEPSSRHRRSGDVDTAPAALTAGAVRPLPDQSAFDRSFGSNTSVGNRSSTGGGAGAGQNSSSIFSPTQLLCPPTPMRAYRSPSPDSIDKLMGLDMGMGMGLGDFDTALEHRQSEGQRDRGRGRSIGTSTGASTYDSTTAASFSGADMSTGQGLGSRGKGFQAGLGRAELGGPLQLGGALGGVENNSSSGSSSSRNWAIGRPIPLVRQNSLEDNKVLLEQTDASSNNNNNNNSCSNTSSGYPHSQHRAALGAFDARDMARDRDSERHNSDGEDSVDHDGEPGVLRTIRHQQQQHHQQLQENAAAHPSQVHFSRDFECEGLLGRGTFADVYKVRPKLGALMSTASDSSGSSSSSGGAQWFAVKKSRHQFRSKRDREWLLNEVRMMQQLQSAVGPVLCTHHSYSRTSHAGSSSGSSSSSGITHDKRQYCGNVGEEQDGKQEISGRQEGKEGSGDEQTEQQTEQQEERQRARTVRGCPYIVQFFRAWQEGGYFHVQLELVERGTLKDLVSMRMDQNATLPHSTMFNILHDVACGLQHTHACGVVHLDIKPANLLISLDGVVKIADFGMAAHIGSREDGHEGDTRYMAKELLDNIERAPSADIFSLGLTLREIGYSQEALERGEVFLPSEGPFWHTLRDGHAPLLAHRPPSLRDAVAQMMHVHPQSRPSASDLLSIPEVCLVAHRRCRAFSAAQTQTHSDAAKGERPEGVREKHSEEESSVEEVDGAGRMGSDAVLLSANVVCATNQVRVYRSASFNPHAIDGHMLHLLQNAAGTGAGTGDAGVLGLGLNGAVLSGPDLEDNRALTPF